MNALAPVIEAAIGVCQKHIERQESEHDFCEDCPLLVRCAASESQEERTGKHGLILNEKGEPVCQHCDTPTNRHYADHPATLPCWSCGQPMLKEDQ